MDKIGYSGIHRLVETEIKYKGWMSKDYSCVYFENEKNAINFYNEMKEWVGCPILIEMSEPLDLLINKTDLYIKKREV